MANVSSLNFVLRGNISDYQTKMRRAQGTMQKFQKNVNTFQKGIVAGVAFGAIVRAGKAALDAYDKQAKAEAKLLTALKGRADVQERLMKQASGLQRKTIYGDEETIEAQARLATILGDNEAAIRKLTPLVQDFATAKGMDLAGAAELVAKTVGSSTNALQRYGITVEGAAGSVEKLESVVSELNKQVGGQAEAAALAGTGSIQQMANAWGDLLETIGEGIAPAMTTVARSLLSLKDVMDDKKLTFWDKLRGFLGDTDVYAQQNLHRAQEELYGHLNPEQLKKVNDLKQKIADQRYLMSVGDDDGILPMRVAFYNSEINSILEESKKVAGKLKVIVEATGSTESGITEEKREQLEIMKFQLTNYKGMLAIFNRFSTKVAGRKAQISTPSQTATPGPIALRSGAGAGIDHFKTEFAPSAENMIDFNQMFAGEFNQFVGSIVDISGRLIDGSDNIRQFTDNAISAFGDFLKQMGKMLIVYGLAMKAFRKAMMNPAGAIAAGIALLAIGSMVVKMHEGGKGLQPMADGGLVYGPTPVMVGEYPGAQSNPEVISPLKDLQKYMGMGGNVTFEIHGDKLRGVLHRHDKRINAAG